MLQIVIWTVILGIAVNAPKLRWTHFAGLAAIAFVATAIATETRTENRSLLGESTNLWDPAIFAPNAAFNFAIYAAIFMLGFGIGHWHRTKKAGGDAKKD
jgi:hypothetical protein